MKTHGIQPEVSGGPYAPSFSSWTDGMSAASEENRERNEVDDWAKRIVSIAFHVVVVDSPLRNPRTKQRPNTVQMAAAEKEGSSMIVWDAAPVVFYNKK